MQISERLEVDSNGWRLVERGFDRDRAVAIGSNFMCGNGYLGYRATSAEARADDHVAVVVTDTYDCADGRWRELTTAPNPLHVMASIDGVAATVAHGREVEWSLDLRLGEFALDFEHHDARGHVATRVRSAGHVVVVAVLRPRADGRSRRPTTDRRHGSVRAGARGRAPCRAAVADRGSHR